MSAEQFSMQHEEAEAADEINLTYERMLEARRSGDATLETTFERRMNLALDKYMDLARFAAQATLLEMPEGA